MSERLIKGLIETEGSRKVAQIEVSFQMVNAKGSVHVTDIMFQNGPIVTNWEAHLSEKRWSNE